MKGSRRVFKPPPPTRQEGKEAPAEQSVEGLEAKAQPFMATHATEEDTGPKVLIRGELRKVPDSYPKDASSQLSRWPSRR